MDSPWWKIVVALGVLVALATLAIRALKASVASAPVERSSGDERSDAPASTPDRDSPR